MTVAIGQTSHPLAATQPRANGAGAKIRLALLLGLAILINVACLPSAAHLSSAAGQEPASPSPAVPPEAPAAGTQPAEVPPDEQSKDNDSQPKPSSGDRGSDDPNQDADSNDSDSQPAAAQPPAAQPAAPTDSLPLPTHTADGRPFRAIAFYWSQIVEIVPDGFVPVSLQQLREAIERPNPTIATLQQARVVDAFFDIHLNERLATSQQSELVIEHLNGRPLRLDLGPTNLALSPADELEGVEPGPGLPGNTALNNTALSNNLLSAPGLGSSSPPVTTASGSTKLRILSNQAGHLIAAIDPVRSAAPGVRSGETSQGPPATSSAGSTTNNSLQPPSTDWSRSTIGFAWSRRTNQLGKRSLVKLQLPRSSRSQLVLSAPSHLRLRSRQGTLTELVRPPERANWRSRPDGVIWYQMEVGGLSEVELEATVQTARTSSPVMMIRRQSRQYDVDLASITWKHQLTVDLSADVDRLQFRVPDETVTGLRINSILYPFEIVRDDPQQPRLEIMLPEALRKSADQQTPNPNQLLRLTVEGVSRWDLRNQLCQLPSVTPIGNRVFWSEPDSLATVTVSAPLQIIQWTLPKHWKTLESKTTTAGDQYLTARGPARGPAVEPTTGDVHAWSSLSLASQVDRVIDHACTHLRYQQPTANELRSETQIRYRIVSRYQPPIRVALNPAWTIDSLRISESGRQIPVAPGNEGVTIWPTSQEASSETLTLEFNGRQNLTRNPEQLLPNQSWVARPQEPSQHCFVAYEPPARRRWNAETVMLANRVDAAQLPKGCLDFLQPSDETLIVRAPRAVLQRVRLAPVSVSLAVNLQHRIEGAREPLWADDQPQPTLIETIVVRADTSGPINQLEVLTGKTRSSAYAWSLRRRDQSAIVSLPESQIIRRQIDHESSETINLDDRDLDDFELVGRRAIRASEQISVSLPSVLGATSQTGQSFIASPWFVSSSSVQVQKVPHGRSANDLARTENEKRAEESGTDKALADETEASQPPSGEDSNGTLRPRFLQHLQYNPQLRSEIELTYQRFSTDQCVVWKQNLDIFASNRGDDEFLYFAEASSQANYDIRFDTDLELISAQVNGQTVLPLESRAGFVRLERQNQTDTIVLRLRREKEAHRWLYWAGTPQISLTGKLVSQRTVFHDTPSCVSLYQVYPPRTDADTATTVHADSGNETSALANGYVLLMSRDMAIGLAWLGAGLVFAFAWAMARWMPLGFPICLLWLVALCIAATLWWDRSQEIIGLLAIPVACGALVQTIGGKNQTSRKLPQRSSISTPTQSSSNPANSANNGSASQRLTNQGPAALMLLITCLLIPSGSLSAQETLPAGDRNGSPTAPRTGEQTSPEKPAGGQANRRLPVQVLVPLDKQAQIVSDKVYLSRADRDEILDLNRDQEPASVSFQNAQYRVVLEARDSDAPFAVTAPDQTNEPLLNCLIEATYDLELSHRSSQLKLPVAAENLRRIEVLGEAEPQTARYTVDGPQQVTALVPISSVRSLQRRLRLTFAGNTQQSVLAGPVPVAAPATDEAAQATMSPNESAQPTLAARLVQIQQPIPVVHSAEVQIEVPSGIQIRSIDTAMGRTLLRPALGRYQAELGPTDQLTITCQNVGDQRSTVFVATQRNYRVVCGATWTTIECELRLDPAMKIGDSMELIVLGKLPQNMTEASWQVTPLRSPAVSTPETASQADSNSGGPQAASTPPDGADTENNVQENNVQENGDRESGELPDLGGILKITKASKGNPPLRLMWQTKSILNANESVSDPATTSIPEVFVPSAADGGPTYFAIEHAEDLKITELISDWEPATMNEFLSRWQGYAGRPQRIIATSEAFPSLLLWDSTSTAGEMELRHQTFVDQSLIHYQVGGELTDPSTGQRPVILKVPRGYELERCVINETELDATEFASNRSQAGKPYWLLNLGDRRINGQLDFELRFVRGLPIKAKFDLPRVSLDASDSRSQQVSLRESYRVTRGQFVSLKWPAKFKISTDPENGDWHLPAQQQRELMTGKVPAAQIDRLPAQSPAIVLQRQTQKQSFSTRQLALMQYSGSRWSCRTEILYSPQRVPSYIDLKLPTRWATDLQVEGSSNWTSKRTPDDAFTIVRVATTTPTDKAAAGKSVSSLVITGFLDNRDVSRVSVPAVDILGQGQRVLFAAVPKQLVTQSVLWVPENAASLAANQVARTGFKQLQPEALEQFEYYTVRDASSNWSIKLSPLDNKDQQATVIACDARVMLGEHDAVVYQRFDLVPENFKQIQLSLPGDAALIGVWVAGRPVAIDPASEGELLNIPLTFSRLPQAVETVLRVPVSEQSTADYLARLPQPQAGPTWVAYFQNRHPGQTQSLLPIRESDRIAFSSAELQHLQHEMALELASSAVTAIDRSRDLLAERSDEEVRAWLLPWLGRYQEAARLDRHQLNTATSMAEASSSETATDPSTQPGAVTEPEASTAETVTAPAESDASAWAELDRKLLSMTGRFVPASTRLPIPLLTARQLIQGQLVGVVRLEHPSDVDRIAALPLANQQLQGLLNHAITMITVVLGVILIWPFRGRWKSILYHPSFWLAVLGLASLVVIPAPIGFVLVLVATTVPWLQRSVSVTGARSKTSRIIAASNSSPGKR